MTVLLAKAAPTPAFLPGYAYQRSTGRWRHIVRGGRLGKFVSRDTISDGIRSLHGASAKMMGELGADVAAGRLSPRVFQQSMMTVGRDLHNSNTALAHGHWDRVPSASWGRNGATLRKEYSYLEMFVLDIVDMKLTPEQIAYRAELYADNAYARYWDERRRVLTGAGYKRAKLIAQPDACEQCTAEAERGWVPIGTLQLPTLHLRCRCTVDWR